MGLCRGPRSDRKVGFHENKIKKPRKAFDFTHMGLY